MTVETLAGVISFDRLVSSERDYDFLIFSINGVEKGRWSGVEATFTTAEYPISAGRNTFSWSFTKDDVDFDDVGFDTAFVDNIHLPGSEQKQRFFVSNKAPNLDQNILLSPVGLGQTLELMQTTAPESGGSQTTTFDFQVRDAAGGGGSLSIGQGLVSDVMGDNIVAGVTVTDPSGKVFDLTESALQFDNSLVRLPARVLEEQRDLTLSFQLSTTQVGPQTILSARDLSGTTSFTVRLADSNTLIVEDADGSGAAFAVSPYSLTDGEPHQLAIIRDAAHGRFQLWVGGQEAVNRCSYPFRRAQPPRQYRTIWLLAHRQRRLRLLTCGRPRHTRLSI